MELRLGQSVVLTPHLQYRARFLTHGGRDFADGNAFDAVAQRARLGIGARVSSWMRVMVEVQDIRAWGEELSTTDLSAEGLDIYQGWAELAVAGWFLRAGRQQLTFDGERLVGKLNWADQGRAFDGLRLYTRRGKWRGELFWVNLGEADVYNATRAADGSEVPTQGAERNGHLAGLWKRYEASPAFNASALAFYDRSRNAIRQDRVTLGGRVDGRIRSKLNYRAEGYFQWGRTGPRAARQTILAYLLTARLGYSLALPWRPTVRAFFDYVSGDSDPNRGRVHSFDTLFGTNHKFYGYMDYFLDIPRDTGGFGLLDGGARVQLVPCRTFKFWVDYHHFRFARRATFGSDRPRSLGNEIDMVLNVDVNQHLKAQAGISTFIPDKGITCLRGGCRDSANTEYFSYLMVTLLI